MPGRRRSRYRYSSLSNSSAVMRSSMRNGSSSERLRIVNSEASTSTAPLAISGFSDPSGRRTVFPRTCTQNSRRNSADSRMPAGSSTTCTIPVWSRRSTNTTPPWWRLRSTHPARVTVSPTVCNPIWEAVWLLTLFPPSPGLLLPHSSRSSRSRVFPIPSLPHLQAHAAHHSRHTWPANG